VQSFLVLEVLKVERRKTSEEKGPGNYKTREKHSAKISSAFFLHKSALPFLGLADSAKRQTQSLMPKQLSTLDLICSSGPGGQSQKWYHKE
jgi:hypothetical protein